MKPGGVFSKLFLGSYFFTIALRERSSQTIIDRTPFRAQMVFPASKDDWMADPMLADDGVRTWLFYEAVKEEKGRIEVVEVLPGCRVSEATVILEDACHYSYPFVFRAHNEWYMIPESAAASEVRLYRAVSFPYQWELQKILLNKRAVDTTVFQKNNQYWLLTFIPDEGTERVFPHAYTLNDWNEPVLKEVPWPVFDSLRVRGAGPVFQAGDKLLRPTQISQEQRYGDGLAFYQVNPEHSYEEQLYFEIFENDVQATGYFIDGLHTYSASSRYEAIDIRCRAADPFKIAKRIMQR